MLKKEPTKHKMLALLKVLSACIKMCLGPVRT